MHPLQVGQLGQFGRVGDSVVFSGAGFGVQFQRQVDRKGRALAQLALYLDGAVHLFDQRHGNGHTQPRALIVLGVGGIGAGVRLIQVGQKFLAHSNAGITDGEAVGRVGGVDGKFFERIVEQTAHMVVLDGVGADIGNDALHMQRAADDMAVRHVEMQADLQLHFFALGVQAVPD